MLVQVILLSFGLAIGISSIRHITQHNLYLTNLWYAGYKNEVLITVSKLVIGLSIVFVALIVGD